VFGDAQGDGDPQAPWGSEVQHPVEVCFLVFSPLFYHRDVTFHSIPAILPLGRGGSLGEKGQA
jgi:hypothetical protein